MTRHNTHAVLSAAILSGVVLALVPASALRAAPAWSVVDRWAGPDGSWDYTTFDPIHRRLYIGRGDGVTAVDVDTGKVTPKLLTASRTHIALPMNDGADIVVTEGGTGSALVADAMSGNIRATIKVGKKPDAAVFDPATGLALVMDNAGGGITLIDAKAGAAVGAIPVDGNLESGAADGAGKVFVNVEDKNEIVVIDTKARKVLAHYPLKGCEEPNGLAYAAAAKVIVSACANGLAEVVDAASGKVLKTLPIGLRSDTAFYDAQRHLVFMPTGQDGVVNVLSADNAKDVKILSKAPSQAGSRSGAVDVKTGRVFLPSAEYGPAVAGGRPTATPGSFKVLVLAGG
jgi:DNA-binding beta-propeller fold protein YncE